MSKDSMDNMRRETLDRIDRNERNFKMAISAAVILESLFLLSFLLLMDSSNRLHLLLLIATIASYSIIILGMVVLATYINRSNLRIIKAIEILASQLLKER